MKKISEPIVFFGSGPVAADSLRLLAEEFKIEAVITKPRAPHHTGSVPVLEAADQLNLKTYTVDSRRSLDNLIEQKPFKVSLAILIDFGIIVSQKVIDYFPFGIINSHFSILPEWRGADPITFAILSGQKQTGVSLMLLTAGMDEGPLIGYREHDLASDITTPELTNRLIELSVALLKHEVPRYLERLESGQKANAPQTVTGRTVSYSRKLTKEDGIIDWSKSAAEIEREIRAFIDWPKSRTRLGDKDIIITKAHVLAGNTPARQSGEVEPSALTDGILMFETNDGRLCVDRLKPAGKREMSAREFLAGNKL